MNAQHCGASLALQALQVLFLWQQSAAIKWLQSRLAAPTSQPLFLVLCSFFCSLLPLTFSSSLKPFLLYSVSTGNRWASHDAYNSLNWSQRTVCKDTINFQCLSSATYKRWQLWISNLESGNLSDTWHSHRTPPIVLTSHLRCHGNLLMTPPRVKTFEWCKIVFARLRF